MSSVLPTPEEQKEKKKRRKLKRMALKNPARPSVEIVEGEDSAESSRRRRRNVTGAVSTRISGIRSAVSAALKKRLG